MKSDFLNGTDDRDGRLSVLEIDTEIFGFPVAEWTLPAEPERLVAAAGLFHEKADALQACLVSCRVPAEQFRMLAAVQDVGFRVVDCLVALGLRNAQKTEPPGEPLPLREARDSDVAELEDIAGQAFQTGRYHLDPAFPRPLADKRYRQWVHNALTGRLPGAVLVAEIDGVIAGFLVHRIEGDRCDGQLACVNPRFKHGIVMFALLNGHTAWLRVHGVRRTTGRISIGLMQAININLAGGADLRSADYVLHWHSSKYPLPRI
jgi:hypothetical protein